jgi:hypothetical protein
VLIAMLLCLVVLACFDAPLGNPETSRIDHRLDGVWIQQEKPGAEYMAFLIVPVDAHVHCMVSSKFSAEGEIQPKETVAFRLWLTTIASYPFVSLEPLAQLLPDYAKKREYVSGRLTFRNDGTLGMQPLSYDYPGLRDEKDPAALMRRVEENIEDPSLLDKVIDYRHPDVSNPVEKKIRDQMMSSG